MAPGGTFCDINPWSVGCPCGGYNPPASCFGFGGDFGGVGAYASIQQDSSGGSGVGGGQVFSNISYPYNDDGGAGWEPTWWDLWYDYQDKRWGPNAPFSPFR